MGVEKGLNEVGYWVNAPKAISKKIESISTLDNFNKAKIDYKN